MAIRHFRELIVWQKSVLLAVQIYEVTRAFPSHERFGLAVQVQRAAVSIAANIAEGHERHSRGDFRRHVSIALGSLAEVDTHLEISERLGYVGVPALAGTRTLLEEVGKMLSSLLGKLRLD